LKLGKVLKDPVEITKFTRRGKSMKRSPEDAVRMCANALASSYGTLDLSYPILGPFCEALQRNGLSSPKPIGSLQESWKPVMSHVRIERRAALLAIYRRYGLTPEDVKRVEGLLHRVTTLPAYVEDPVFDALCEKDY
jgi:hypothetical protein